MTTHTKDRFSGWGPFSPTCRGHTERIAQLRCLRAIAHLQLGPHHPLVAQLCAAESDPMAYAKAQEAVEQLPALKRRHLIAAFAGINWPRGRRPLSETPGAGEYDSDDDVRKSFEEAYRAIRERAAAGGPGWTPKGGQS